MFPAKHNGTSMRFNWRARKSVIINHSSMISRKCSIKSDSLGIFNSLFNGVQSLVWPEIIQIRADAVKVVSRNSTVVYSFWHFPAPCKQSQHKDRIPWEMPSLPLAIGRFSDASNIPCPQMLNFECNQKNLIEIQVKTKQDTGLLF